MRRIDLRPTQKSELRGTLGDIATGTLLMTLGDALSLYEDIEVVLPDLAGGDLLVLPGRVAHPTKGRAAPAPRAVSDRHRFSRSAQRDARLSGGVDGERSTSSYVRRRFRPKPYRSAEKPDADAPFPKSRFAGRCPIQSRRGDSRVGLTHITGMTPLAQLRQTLPPPDQIEDEILRLKKERNAVLLAHYYQESDIQDLADHVGDSLGLARAAQKTTADVIAFAGVHFMAEVAKILNPERIVVLPDLEAGCSLADGCPPDQFRRFIDAHPGHVVVSYVNCSAAVKAMSDVIVTSSNAVKIVQQLGDQPIIFAPDKHLGRYVAKQTGRDLVLWQGTCIVHETFSEKRIIELMLRNPGAELIAHPECEESVLRHATFIGSTTALLKHAVASPAQTIIVATEEGILHAMRRDAPHKTFIPAPPEDESCACNQCPHMRRNTLEKLYLCLCDLSPRIELDEALRVRAKQPIDRGCWKCPTGV